VRKTGRIFTATPWGSASWRRGYNRHSAIERINSRLDNSFNFETHYIRGLVKMNARVGPCRTGPGGDDGAGPRAAAGRDAERMRSLVGAVPHLDTG